MRSQQSRIFFFFVSSAYAQLMEGWIKIELSFRHQWHLLLLSSKWYLKLVCIYSCMYRELCHATVSSTQSFFLFFPTFIYLGVKYYEMEIFFTALIIIFASSLVCRTYVETQYVGNTFFFFSIRGWFLGNVLIRPFAGDESLCPICWCIKINDE